MSQPADLDPSKRQLAARRALDDLGSDRGNRVLLRVRCGRSHHVATVLDTAVGKVYEAVVGPHAHGRRDFVDEAHHESTQGTRFIDLLDGDRFADDMVPASCECGTHELSRTEMRRAIDAHQRTIQLT